jgi:DNA-binding CsgD family transcriptional regulator
MGGTLPRNPIVVAAAGELERRRGQRFEQHDVLFRTMQKITTVDAFYVAEFVGENSVHYHHQYDGDVFDLPGSHSVRPGGVAAWVRRNRRTYRFSEDDGHLLNAGFPFGEIDKVSRDALVAPVFGGEHEAVVGLVSIQTYQPDCYGNVAVTVLEEVAGAFAAQLAHESLSSVAGAGTDRSGGSFVSHTLTALGSVHDQVTRDLRRAQAGEDDLELALRSIKRRLEWLLSDLWARELHEHRRVAAWLAELTVRQRDLALLMGRRLGSDGRVPSNAELATAMGVSEATVKTHINAVLRVFDAEDKQDVAAAVWRLLETRDHRTS